MDIKEEKDNKPTEGAEQVKPKKKHWLRPTWLRWTVRCIVCLILLVVSIPILIYIPPVQTFLKNVACKVVYDKTGMKIEIDKFRIKFPLDVNLKGVSVVEATGDTMVRAKDVIADVKLMPLFHLDVDVKKLKLIDGYYRLVSADSSMIMKLNAGLLEVDDKSFVQIKESNINLNKAILKDADVQMYMDVWKKKETPEDTTSTPFLINIHDLQAQNLRFGMSMLPTIDTLSFQTDHLSLIQGVINLRTNEISADSLKASTGNFEYLTPTAEYIASHPLPPDTIPTKETPPMIIRAKSVGLSDFNALYGIAGAKPKPGFDAEYLQLSGVNIELENFFNEASTLRLPIRKLQGTERCGLQIVEGSGDVELNEEGIDISKLNVRTTHSVLNLTANIPFALMELKPRAKVDINADMSIGLQDVVAFMPSLATYTRHFPSYEHLNVDLTARGTLQNVEIPRLDLSMPSIFSLEAYGQARNPLDFKQMSAAINFEGALRNPGTVEQFTGNLGFSLPPFRIKGKAGIDPDNYVADFTLDTPQGGVVADGALRLSSETYKAHLNIDNVNVGYFMPDLGIGKVTATLEAEGNGFNPMKPRAGTDVNLQVASIDYQGMTFKDLSLKAKLADTNYSVDFVSPNTNADISLALAGVIQPDKYSANGYIDCNNLDLQALGFDESVNHGRFSLCVDGTVSPDKWLYDISLSLDHFDWEIGEEYIELPNDIFLDATATENSVYLGLDCQQTNLTFTSTEGLQALVEKFTNAGGLIMEAIENKEMEFESLHEALPQFDLSISTPDNGIVNEFMSKTGVSFDDFRFNLKNDSIISGGVDLTGLKTESLSLDTITLGLSQRNNLMDYKLHLGNAPGTMDEFANVNLSGYVGANRISAYLNQQNLQGETGYRLGLTAALQDSTLTVHFTPLKSTLAYRPWTLNADNYVDVNMKNYKVEANLEASSNESSVLLMTQVGADDQQELRLKLTDIKVQDFMNMAVNAPPMTATVNSDIRARYDGKELVGIGRIKITDFTYDNAPISDLNLGLNANVDIDGASEFSATLSVEGKKALALSTKLSPNGDAGLQPEFIKLNLSHFPLSIANAFLGADVAQLSGGLTGEMDMTGSLTEPILNGSINCDSVAVYLPIMGSSLKFDKDPLVVDNNVISFDNFKIYGANANPLTISGDVDAEDFSDIQLDISANANNFQLINNDSRAGSDLYGKLFLNLSAQAYGPMKHFDVNADLNILGSTDVTYNIPTVASAIQTDKEEGVVKFVNLNDTVQDLAPKAPANMFMRLNARASITPGTQVTVNLSPNGTDKVQVTPSGTLTLNKNFMDDMTLNGQLRVGEGFVRYNIPVIGQKMFEFDPNSSISWNGAMMNPILNIKATDTMKVNVMQNNNSHLVNFLVDLNISGTLSAPKMLFDLSTNDDLTIENQLQSMTPEQRNSAAMNILITGQYSYGDISTSNSSMLMNNVYGLLTSQLNSWAAKNIRGVDLSFGVDQYDNTVDGQSSTAMSYSYQLSKSLFNNRFKINVGGNYSTDDSADENLTQNLISDISFEYMLRQTQTQTMLVKLFRHNGYESILEGEITEMGVGFVLKKKIGNLGSLFRFRRRKRKDKAEADSVKAVNQTIVTTSEGGKNEK